MGLDGGGGTVVLVMVEVPQVNLFYSRVAKKWTSALFSGAILRGWENPNGATLIGGMRGRPQRDQYAENAEGGSRPKASP